jgi:hypothetical protein
MATQNQIAQSMIQQLRGLDPSISAEVGTPERRIIDTVAQAIADSQIDLNILQGAFDIESKFGDDLDNMLAILGFGRQSGVKATGYVTFLRSTAATSPVVIRSGTNVFTPNGGDSNVSVVFTTTATVTLEVGQTEVVAPIEAIQIGTIGNVAANTITETVGTPVYGITGVNNPYPTTGGKNQETDDELKARFTTAGPFRNLAGTFDQFMSLALSTVSNKAIVIGPISKYKEYVQIPSTYDGGNEGNGPSDKISQFTTALSNNVNSKHIYDNLPYFVLNDSGIAPIYYSADYDYTLNIAPVNKNKGDAARNSESIDPTSTESPIIYQPNLTFNGVYTGDINYRPDNVVAPGDVLLFEHSYMSAASRNDYDKNILNCVDVYVNGSDAQTANTTIPRPGNSVPTFTFVDDKTSAFYINNYRRMGSPGHRPIANNVFTPLYNQPVIDLPDQISLTNGSFKKDVHYWLVEEITGLYGTVRARNGIEWSTTIPAKKSSDPDDGPYTGEYINTSYLSMSNLIVDLPATSGTSTTTTTYTKSTTSGSKARASGVATLTIGSHPFKTGDTVNISVTSDASFSVDGVVITAGGSTISYTNTGSPVSTTAGQTIAVTLVTIGAGNTTPIQVASTAAFPTTGYILVGSEILQYDSKASNTFTITQRGCFQTTKAAIPATTGVGSTIQLLIEIETTSLDKFPLSDYIVIDSEQMQYTKPVSGSNSLLKINQRAANGTYATAHVAGSSVYMLLTSVDSAVAIDNYQYDENIILLQGLLEQNKQVTTDVLAHKAKVRYFKPDITVMYAPGSNKASVNESIRTSLSSYFNLLYFGSEIQLSDILQNVHNVGGVDNVRWSSDAIDKKYDEEDNARVPLIETNQFGDPINQPILELIQIGDTVNATKYLLYLPYLTADKATRLLPPTNLSAQDGDETTTLTGTYYYTITAKNQYGQTTKSTTLTYTLTTNLKSIVLSWAEVEGATEYKIYRNTSDSWTSGNLLVDTVEAGGNNSYEDLGASTDPGLPPVVNQALTGVDSDNYVVNNFKIQYDQNEPVEIEFDDFVTEQYDVGVSYSKGDIVQLGSKFYIALVGDEDNPNIGQSPSLGGSTFWKEDFVNKIGFSAKLNSTSTLVEVSSDNNFATLPSFDNPITIALSNKSVKDALSIVSTNVNTGIGAYSEDFQIGDGELASLPEGDLTSAVTIRIKAQNTWKNL